MAQVLTDLGIKDVFAQWLDISLTTFDVALFQNDIVPNRGTLLTDLVVADYGGYETQEAQEAGLIFLNPDGFYEFDLPAINFTRAVGATSNMIYGYYVIKTGLTDLLWCERFDAGPYPFVTPGQGVAFIPKLQFRGTVGP